MLFKVTYQEEVTFCEVYEAKDQEDAYRQFYTQLDDEDIEPYEVLFSDLIIDKTTTIDV